MDPLFGLDRVSAHDDSLALLATVFDPTEALLIEGLLRDAEIPYLKKERGSGASVRVIAGFSVFGCDIFVRKEDLPTALELVTPPEDGTFVESPEEWEDSEEETE